MGVLIHLHSWHRKFTGGSPTVEVEGATVGQCLESLLARYPALRGELMGKEGKLKNTIEIYLNLKSAYPGELLKPTADGDEIHITVALAGG
jgi:molybdopterin converting factor small subunit